jgi:deoxyribodipyrimidine photo-lyase
MGRRGDGVTLLPVPSPDEVRGWVGEHLLHVSCDDEVLPSARFTGTQAAADAALSALDVRGYARRRNAVLPRSSRGATALSPWIRHGLIALPDVWDAVDGAPGKDRQKYRDELLWQEYARHVYARLGGRMRDGLRYEPAARDPESDPWDRSMACMAAVVDELTDDGWLVNQTRMWMASQWSVRHGADWRDGEDRFFRHLLDGSRAANRLGWQWTVGAGTGKPYGFSRWQVEKRAPQLCRRCPLCSACPIQDWPDDPPLTAAGADDRTRADDQPLRTGGPPAVQSSGPADVVWLTAESLGDGDPALAANDRLPVVFVFDEPLLVGLRLASKRLVFLAERLAELAVDRELELHLGDPLDVLTGRRLATTYAPVPKARRLRRRLDVVELHPWPWLLRPAGGPISSFSAWRRAVRR